MAARQLLTYSLLTKNTMTIRGPYCSSCLNANQHNIRKMDDEGDLLIYLHTTTQPNPVFLLDALETSNGALRPFDQQIEPENAAYLPCTDSGCKTNHHLFEQHWGAGFKQGEFSTVSSVTELPAGKHLIASPDEETVIPMDKINHRSFKNRQFSAESGCDRYPPFFLRSENIIHPLKLTEEAMNNLKKAVNDRQKLSLISKTMESRYPDFWRTMKDNNSFMTCTACDLNLSGVAPMVQHILSSKHLNKLNGDGDAFDKRDLQILNGIIAEATSQPMPPAMEKPIQAKRRLFPATGDSFLLPANTTVVDVPLPSSKCQQFNSGTGSSPLTYKKADNKGKKNGDGRVPLFTGTSHPIGVDNADMSHLITHANDELSKYFLVTDFKKLKRACDAKGWKEENCPYCPKDLKFKNDFPGHVLSAQHLRMMMARGVYPFKEDFATLTALLAGIKFAADEKRRISLPFYYGSPEESKQVNEFKFAHFLEKYRSRLVEFPIHVVRKILESEYKRPDSCLFCDMPLLDGAQRFLHVLSPQHVRKVLESKRYFTSWDVSQMRDLVRKIGEATTIDRSWQTPQSSPYC